MSKLTTQQLAERIAAQPLYQAIIIFIFSGLIALIDGKGDMLGVGTTSTNAAWITMTTSMLFYALCSSILSLKAKNQGRYWRNGIFTFMGLAVACGLLATAISGQSIDEAGSFRWLFVVLAIGYLVFCAIVSLIRKIVELAVKQDDKLRGE